MKKLYFALCFILIILSAFWNISVYAAGGAGGSWDNDSGFGGNGGSTGGSGAGGSTGGTVMCSSPLGGSDMVPSSQLSSITQSWCKSNSSVELVIPGVTDTAKQYSVTCKYNDFAPNRGRRTGWCYPPEKPVDPECPVDMHWDGSNCVKDLKCPAGYVKDGNKCIWQCPAGYKMLGGNCVKDDMPEDCDPAIQTCDENGEPVCDCCGAVSGLGIRSFGSIGCLL